MGWIKDEIVQYLIGVYEGFFSNVADLYALAEITPSEWHGGVLWNHVVNFNQNVVLPIGWTILSLFLLLELASLFKQADAKGLESIYWIMMIFMKIIISKTIMDNLDMIIGAIFEISATLVNNGSSYLFNSGAMEIDVSSFGDTFEGATTLECIGYFLMGLLLHLGQSICHILAKVVIQLRFLEIYVFVGVAALPFATLSSKEYSSIGKNFIKRLVGLAVHVVFICLVLYMYVIIAPTSLVATDSSPTGALFDAFGYTLLMIISLFQTGGWSKSLVGAN